MTDSVTLWLSERLVTASLQGAGVIALVWLVCRSLPNIPASVRATLWWLAALKLVVVMLPVPALPIPVLPAAFDVYQNASAAFLDWRRERSSPSPTMAGSLIAGRSDTVAATAAHGATETPGAASEPGASRWLAAAIVLWFAVVVLQAVRLAAAFRMLRGVVRRSARWTDEAGVVARLAALIGLRRAPQVRVSDEIHAPQVAGLWRPVVIVPAEAVTAFTAEERAMTLCHELMHLRRHDLALGWVPALAERLFFFHPLARLAAREYITSRESACDAAVVRALGVSPTDYGRMLVHLGVAGSEPALTAGGSSTSMSSLRRRLEMLQYAASPEASRRSAWLIAAIACALIPLQLVARTAPAQQTAADPRVSEAPRAAVPVLPSDPAGLPQRLDGVPPGTSGPRASVPVDPLPREIAPSQPAHDAEAAPQDDRAAVQDAERAFAELVRRNQEAEALRLKSTEYALRLQVERETAEQQSRESDLKRIEAMLNSIATQNARARDEQDSRESRERMLEQIARQARQQQQAGASPNVQLEQLQRQVEALARQLEQVAAQQEQLAVAQRRLAEQAEAIRRLSEDTERIRKAIEAR